MPDRLVETRRTRFSGPTVGRFALERPALEQRLDAAFGVRLTSVVAGAGFGKTTAVAAWARDIRCAWHTASPRDSRFGTFAHSLVEVVEAGVQTELALPRGTLEGDVADLERPEAVAAFLARELDRRLAHDLVIVLDDVHELGPNGPSAQLVDAFCRQLPSTAHLVLLSRLEPPFPTSRLRGRGELVEIDATDLAFDVLAVRALTTRILGPEGAELADPIHERTGGWPVAVRLVLERLRDTPVEERPTALSLVPDELVGYLAAEVLEREPASTRELIRILAPFEHTTADLAEALGATDARSELESLVRRGIFVARHEGETGSFALHSLVKDLAADRLGIDSASRTALHRRAARWFEGRGEIKAAFRESALARDRASLERLLVEHGNELVARGDAASIVAVAAEQLDERCDPTAEQALGDAHALRAEWDEALSRYERASDGSDALPAGLAWRIGRVHFDQGRLEAALAAYVRGRADGSSPADEAVLHAWTASCRWSLGEREQAELLATQALTEGRALGENRALAVAHNVLMLVALGGRDDGGAHFRAGLDAAEKLRDARLLVRLRANRATQLAGQGAYAGALEAIGPALEAAELGGGGLQVAFPLMKRGECHLHLGRLDDAIADFKAALATYERFGSLRRFGALLNLGDAYLARGDTALARIALDDAVRNGRETGDAQLVLFGASSLARVVAFEDPSWAQELAELATETGRGLGFGLDLALTTAGWVALAVGARDEAARLAHEAEVEAEARGARPVLAEATLLGALASDDPASEARAFEHAVELWREAGDEISQAIAELVRSRLVADDANRPRELAAERTLRTAGVRVASLARVAGPLAFVPPKRPPPVEIRTLSAFALLREGQVVPISRWRSRQARELLKVLVARRGRAVAREQLMSILWPDEDATAVSSRFSFVLSTLRSVLEPERAKNEPALVETAGAVVRLRSDLVEIDVETFLRDAESGLAAPKGSSDRLALLEHAEAGYGGDFLEEDPYADWAVALREEARTAYIAVTRALAEAREAEGDHGGAARYLLRILERDEYDEGAHLDLVTVLEASSAHGEARRAYRRYVSAMAELDVEPAPHPHGRG